MTTIKLNDYGDNSTRMPSTLSFHSASRLGQSLRLWVKEIDLEVYRGREDEHYQGLVYNTINTEARHLEDWCREQNRVHGTDYFDCIIEDLVSLQKDTQDLAMQACNTNISLTMNLVEQEEKDPSEDPEHLDFLKAWLVREQEALGAIRRVS
jgi:hypothetical protein